MGSIVYIPKMGANIVEVEIVRIYVKQGDQIKKGDVLFDMVTDKATFEVEAETDGKLLSLLIEEGETLQVLDEVGYIGEEGEQVPSLKKSDFLKREINSSFEKETTVVNSGDYRDRSNKIKITPLARKIAKENNVDIQSIFGGMEKIIKEKDIVEYLTGKEKKNIFSPMTVDPVPELQSYSKEKPTAHKRMEIEALSQSKDCLYSLVTLSVRELPFKQELQKVSDNHEMRLQKGEFISYHCAKLLDKFSKLNSFYANNFLCLYNDINIGFAVNIDDELIVPVIKNANNLSLSLFSQRFNDLIMQIFRKKISPNDLQEGTFTITDLSSFNVLNFSPVINSKQSAILAISSVYDSCRQEEGVLAYDPKFNLTLAFDHRVVDGKYALSFLQALVKKLEGN